MSSVPTMVIIDDSRLSRMLIRAFVTQTYPDWNIIEASDGHEALEKTSALNVDAMTIDLNMPGIDGLTLATTFRTKYPQAHITILTANIQDSVRHRAEAAGVGFLVKPITENNVLAFLAGMEERHG